ncbi:hypothetical protein ACIBXA_30330 [Micromonospora echinaurantiaca]|uniref:hypothetical protein n=1 Tax=Micromonospora echinaurantiaca TaxID=47857 RepID=UPI003794DFA0
MTDPTNPTPADEPAGQPQPAPEPPMAPRDPQPDATLPFSAAAQPQVTIPLGAPISPKRSNARAWAVGGLALAIALAAGAVIGAFVAEDAEPAAIANTSTSPAPSATPTTPASTTVAPTTAAPTSAAPSPTKTTPAPKPKPPSYKTLSERQWKLIAKNPDAYIGKTYVVYGVVTQFDAATGVDTFRADVAHRRMADKYDYETNTLLTGLAADLDNLVEDDIFRANVTVLSSFSYGTQIGGETTVPLLQVDSIKVL